MQTNQPSLLLKHLIDLCDSMFELNFNVDSEQFDQATNDYFNAVVCEIHKIVKTFGLQHEYFELSANTALEGVADEWLEKNPFNPEDASNKSCVW